LSARRRPRLNVRLNARLRVAAGLGAALLTACGSMAPAYERPAAPVPERFPLAASAAAASPTAAAADLPWQAFFTDPRLRQRIATALQNNRDLRVAVLNIEQARATARVRDADLWPTLNAGITGTRQPTASGGVSSLYSAGLQVSAYELDLFDRLRSLGDAAAQQLLASQEARKAVQIGLIAGVATAHLALQADDDALHVTQQTLLTRQDTLRLTTLRFDNGAASMLDLRGAESLLAAAQVNQAQQTRQRALDENALVLLLGRASGMAQGEPAQAAEAAEAAASVATSASAASGLSANPPLPDVPAGIPSEVLTRRPDVRQAELQLIAANANIGAARAAFYPRITLTASLGSVSGALSGLFKAGTGAWSFAPQLLQPIFDAGRNQANLAFSVAARDIAVAQYEKAVQTAFREVADALAGRATLQDQLRAQTALLLAEQGRLALTELRFRNGASSALEVLDAQRSLYAAQLARVQVQALVQQNAVALYRVLGGGWTESGR
jgi:multidrug efflux system outer membrane protein